MSGSVSGMPYPALDLTTPPAPDNNPLQKYLDQVSFLHGYTPMINGTAPAPVPVGTETVQSMGVPSQADAPVAFLGAGGQPVYQSDLERAHGQIRTAMDVAPTMVLGMVGDAPGSTGNVLARSALADTAKGVDWKPARTSPDYQTIPIDVGKLDNSWSKDDLYVGPGGQGGMAKRYAGFQDYLGTGQPVTTPEVGLGPDGEIRFGNGRHRFSVMRDLGVDTLPVTVPAEDAAEISRRFGPDQAPAAPAAPEVNPLRTYHGTPHLFPPTETNPLGAFDLSKIGTGEGAQAYGHGAYVAENPDVAQYYRETVNGPTTFDASAHGGPEAASINDMKSHLSDQMFDDEDLEHLDPGTMGRATNWVVDQLARGVLPEDFENGQVNIPNVLRSDDGMQAINAAVDKMRDIDVRIPGEASVGGKMFNPTDPMHKASWYLGQNGGDVPKTLGKIDDEIQMMKDRALAGYSKNVGTIPPGHYADAIDRLNTIKGLIGDAGNEYEIPKYKPPGHMYEVDVNAKPEDFLHWNKSFGDQSAQVQAGLQKLGVKDRGQTGEDIYHDLTNQQGLIRQGAQAKASQALVDAGVPGIRYADQGSRMASQESKSHNLVVFNPSVMRIVKRYGIGALLPVSAGAGLAAGQEQ